MSTIRILLAGAACAGAVALAVETRTWVTSEAAEFEKGKLKGVAVSSNGRVTLAPVLRELHDALVPLLWAAAADSRGRVYAGGANGKLFVVEAGKGRLLAEVPGGDIYAIAVNRRDEVFAATAPDGKVYRMAAGKPEVFYDPKAKYIWALAFDPAGNLFVATGDKGEVHRVPPGGQGALFYSTEETHARSLALDAAGNLLVGTDPGGLVIRVNARGEGFVVYQTPRREVTALAVDASGATYAAAAGAKAQAAPAAPPPAQIPVTAPAPGVAAAAAAAAAAVRPSQPPPTLAPAAGPAGGSEIFRITPDGAPRRVWTHAQHLVYSLAFDARQRLVAATGNQGAIYRLDSDSIATRLADAEPAQITALAAGPGGALFAATANPGKVMQLGPETEKSGTVESESFDAAAFSRWGRLTMEAHANGGSVVIETRSGNTEIPQKNWAPWTPLNADRVASPGARFLAWRATLTAAPGGSSPELRKVEIAWQPQNLGPLVERIEITPANYKFAAQSLTLSSASTLSLPAMSQPRRSPPSAPTAESGGAAVTMNAERGARGARWRASDPNGDTLEFKVEIRGQGEREWKLLKEELRDTKYSWDSTAWPDGEYTVRVTASDLPENFAGRALSASLESDPFTIDNSPPEIGGLTAQVQGAKLAIRFRATDALTPLESAEYSVNGGPWTAAEPAGGLTDSREHDYTAEAAKPAGAEFTVAVRVSDENGNTAVRKVVVR